MKKNIILTAAVALLLCSCEDFLDRYPQGGTIRQDQYEQLADQLEGSVRGLYVKLYSDGSSNHDVFGKRSFDLWGDLLCSDIALTGKTYGWLYLDEQMLTTNRTGTIWGYYYSLLHNINATILGFKNGSTFMEELDEYGWPSENSTYWTKEKVSEYSTNAVYYAQCLGLRGYCYTQLAKWYTPVIGSDVMKGKTILDYKCCPVYTEDNMETAGPRQTSDSVYRQGFNDYEKAIRLYEEFNPTYSRPNKLTVDHEVLCALLAQAYLNECVYRETKNPTLYKEHLNKALDNADKVIASGKYTMVTRENLLDNGWNNIADPSWVWGQEVTVETAGGLKSWFGQCDIHSYSYSWAGDTKVLDGALKTSIPNWDRRSLWFNDGKKQKVYLDCPDKKFFSNKNQYSTNADSIDREWLSDNVFLRYEAVILCKAEAQYRLEQYSDAATTLFQITDERVKDASEYFAAEEEYADWKTDVQASNDMLKQQIIYNWRMEMWGEGYGLETFRRWKDDRKRGDNHDYAPGNDAKATENTYNMNIPSSESTYNPNIPEPDETEEK